MLRILGVLAAMPQVGNTTGNRVRTHRATAVPKASVVVATTIAARVGKMPPDTRRRLPRYGHRACRRRRGRSRRIHAR